MEETKQNKETDLERKKRWVMEDIKELSKFIICEFGYITHNIIKTHGYSKNANALQKTQML